MAKQRKANEIKVGVVGYGGAFNMGKGHLDEMAAAGMTPSAVAEIDPARLKTAAKDFPGIGLYGSVGEMLKDSDVDLVTIITPHNSHADLACQCLRARRHVVVEKPFAITTAECDRMIAAAEKNDVMLSTYHNRHWDGCILQAVKTIRAGTIGEVVRVEARMGAWGKPRDWWRSSKSISGGILYDWGVHLMEYTLQIVDAEIVEVSGFLKTGVWAEKVAWKEDTNEDEGFVTVRYASGAWSTLRISHLDPNVKPGLVEITGTKGAYVMDHQNYTIITPSAGGKSVTRRGPNPPEQRKNYYANVADHLTGGTELVISPQWARRPVHVLDLACRSAAAGKALPAKYA